MNSSEIGAPVPRPAVKNGDTPGASRRARGDHALCDLRGEADRALDRPMPASPTASPTSSPSTTIEASNSGERSDAVTWKSDEYRADEADKESDRTKQEEANSTYEKCASNQQ